MIGNHRENAPGIGRGSQIFLLWRLESMLQWIRLLFVASDNSVSYKTRPQPRAAVAHEPSQAKEQCLVEKSQARASAVQETVTGRSACATKEICTRLEKSGLCIFGVATLCLIGSGIGWPLGGPSVAQGPPKRHAWVTPRLELNKCFVCNES